MQRLAERMRVPSGSRARLEAHARRPDSSRRRRVDDRVLPHSSGERVGWSAARRHGSRLGNVHDVAGS